jgi:hypothetical protein
VHQFGGLCVETLEVHLAIHCADHTATQAAVAIKGGEVGV